MKKLTSIQIIRLTDNAFFLIDKELISSGNSNKSNQIQGVVLCEADVGPKQFSGISGKSNNSKWSNCIWLLKSKQKISLPRAVLKEELKV